MKETVYFSVKVPMRDGTLLATDIYLPYANGKFPCILIRSPYGGCSSVSDYCIGYAQKGYAFVQQDCRGTCASPGESDLWRQEKDDGEDCLKWLEKEPWFNGNLVTNGESYPGHTQWQLARSGNPVLKGITPHNAPLDLNGTINYHNGAMALSVALFWGLAMRARRIGVHIDAKKALGRLPLLSADEASGLGKWDLWRKWVAQQTRSPETEEVNILRDIGRVAAPAYITAGWFDAFLKDSIRAFTELKKRGKTPEARNFTRLCIEPLDHDMRTHEVDYGKNHLHDIVSVRDRFMEGLMANPHADPLEGEAAVTLFVMGSNKWLCADGWPVPGLSVKPLYLGRGWTLLENAPGEENGFDSFIYNPGNPVPTLGGNNLGSVCPGQREQSSIEEREDVLVYTSEPLEKDLTVIGELYATIWGSSTAPDTDFTVKLCDVHPDGRSYNVADGIIRARYRTGEDSETFLECDKPEEFKIDLWATATTFLAGHRIRLQVSSSNFPRFDANPNSPLPHGLEERITSARQCVFRSRAMASRIDLPVLENPVWADL